jgi:hypothetical protein
MTAPKIETPRGKIVQTENGKAQLVWNPAVFSGGGRGSWQGRYTAAQEFMDSEVLRLCEPYIPLRTSMLIKSGILGTDIGSGEVKWIAPYAKAQYYSPRKAGSMTGPLRGPFWFERMKVASGRKIVAGARKIAGGK